MIQRSVGLLCDATSLALNVFAILGNRRPGRLGETQTEILHSGIEEETDRGQMERTTVLRLRVAGHAVLRTARTRPQDMHVKGGIMPRLCGSPRNVRSSHALEVLIGVSCDEVRLIGWCFKPRTEG